MCGPLNIQRSHSMPNLQVHLDGPQPPQPGPQGPGNPPVAPNPPPLDPVVQNAVNNPVPPQLQPGNGQGEQFAARHVVGTGRDWDLHSAKGVLDTAQAAIRNIKTVIGGNQKLEEFKNRIDNARRAAMQAYAEHPRGDLATLGQSYENFTDVLCRLKAARAELTAAIKDGSGQDDPREGLAEILKTLRVFRYEMQVELGKRGHEAGRMGFNEGNLRLIQHTFTFGVGSKVAETFARVEELERELDHAFSQFCDSLNAINPGTPLPEMQAGVKLADVAGEALELSHLTNDQIRDFQNADASSATLRDILGEIAKKGGSRKVEFNVGVGALIGLGFSSALTAGVRVGARFRVIGEIECAGKGRPISATFRIAGGLDAKAGVKAGEEGFVPGAKAEAGGTAGVTHFTTRSYATLEDLILDAKNCRLATSRTVGGAIWGGIKYLGRSIGSLGSKFFCWLGRKSGEVKQNVAQYLQTLQSRGVAGALDKLLAKRANPIVVAERKGWSFLGLLGAKGSLTLGQNAVGLSASVKGTYEREFKVQSKSFGHVARFARAAGSIEALGALMRPDPDTHAATPLFRFEPGTSQEDAIGSIEDRFDAAVREGKGLKESNVAGFARVAHKIRSLLLAIEAACLDNVISRADADRLLERYSNPEVRFPSDIFREYFLEGTGAAKPAKKRISAEAKFKVDVLPKWDETLTSGIDNLVGKAVAGGAVNTLKREIGLETAIQYRFSRESPVVPGADPRPWENTVKTKHEMLITASAPARYLLDGITRSIVNRGERVENQSQHLKKDVLKETAKDIAKDTALTALYETLPGLILASVAETALSRVKEWLSDKANVEKLVNFALDHLDDAFGFLVKVAEFLAKHPDFTMQAVASILGTSSLGDSERAKKISWSFVDGRLETITVSSDTENKIGVDVDPVGVAVGLGFDLSYSVTESVKERDVTPRPTLTMLLAKGEEFLFGETGIGPAGGGQPFKTWLSRNAMGVQHMLAHLMDGENMAQTADIYARAQMASDGDAVLLQRLQDAWHAVHALPADATLDRKVDAAHELIVAMVLAYRTQSAEAA